MNVQALSNPLIKTSRRIALLGMAGSVLVDALYLYLIIQQPAWQLFVLFADTFALLVATIISLIWIQRGNTTRGMLLLVGAAQISFALGSVFITGIGLAFALGIAFITAMAAGPTLPSRETVTLSITAGISGLICIVLDAVSPAYRLTAPLLVEVGVPLVIALVAVTFSGLLIQQFRYSLRAKLLLGFTAVFTVAGIFAFFAIRQQVLNTQQAAVTEASNVAESIALSVGRYPGSAQDYVTQLYRNQQRLVEIVDLQKRILADPISSEVFTIYTSDPAGQVAATLQDGQIRTFIAHEEGGQNANILVAPVHNASGKISGAAIVDYTSLLQQLQTATNATTSALINFGAAALIVLFAALQFVASQIADPIALLRDSAEKVGSGQIDTPIPEQRTDDEIGSLTSSFKNMTAQLRNLIGTLEQRVTERTAELASASQQSSNRAAQLEAISKIAESIAAIHDLEELLPQITQTISQQFGFYHVGIFLNDEAREFANLHAANSAGGQRMLERHHRLRIGEQGIVGFVAAKGTPRIALDTGVDAVFFNNPDLPTTRSEMALPLIVNEAVIGVLDVQSEKPSAFSREDINVLSTLANQVSIAIQNARLFEELNRSLGEARASYEQYVQSALSQAGMHKRIGYQLTGKGLLRLDQPMENPHIDSVLAKGSKFIKSADGENENAELTIPIKLRDTVIGVMDIRKARLQDWNEDEVDIVEALAERVALAVENAALLEETQRRASKERLIGEVTSKISASINMRNILQTAAEELGRAIPGSEVLIQFQSDRQNDK